MTRKWIGALCAFWILACTGGAEEDADPPACTDDAFMKAVDGYNDGFEIKKLGHRACDADRALVAVEYTCTECEPFEQFYLGGKAGDWEVLSSGTGMDPSECSSTDIDEDRCKKLWKAFEEDAGKGKKKKKKRKKK